MDAASTYNYIIKHIIQIIPILIASISAVIAISSRRIAKKAMTITTKTYHDKQANFSIYLIEGYRWKGSVKNVPIILFNISINNKSDSKNTLKCSLEIEYFKPNGKFTKAIITHDPNLKSRIPNSKITPFPIEIRLDEKHTESKWILFQQPQDPFLKYKINKYIIRMTDNKNNEQIAETYLLKGLNENVI
jgi:hypothetical protein